MRFRNLTLLFLSVSSAALAQTHFCIAGDLDHLNAAQVAECKTKMTNVRDAVKRRGAPSGWHSWWCATKAAGATMPVSSHRQAEN